MRMYYVTKVALMILVVFNIINCYRSATSSPMGISATQATFASSIPSNYTYTPAVRHTQETMAFDTSLMTVNSSSKSTGLILPAKVLKEIRLTMNHIDSLNSAVQENIQASLPEKAN